MFSCSSLLLPFGLVLVVVVVGLASSGAGVESGLTRSKRRGTGSARSVITACAVGSSDQGTRAEDYRRIAGKALVLARLGIPQLDFVSADRCHDTAESVLWVLDPTVERCPLVLERSQLGRKFWLIVFRIAVAHFSPQIRLAGAENPRGSWEPWSRSGLASHLADRIIEESKRVTGDDDPTKPGPCISQPPRRSCARRVLSSLANLRIRERLYTGRAAGLPYDRIPRKAGGFSWTTMLAKGFAIFVEQRECVRKPSPASSGFHQVRSRISRKGAGGFLSTGSEGSPPPSTLRSLTSSMRIAEAKPRSLPATRERND